MKKTLFYTLLVTLAWSLVACNNQDEPLNHQVRSEKINQKVSHVTENIAELVASIPLTKEIVEEVYNATQDGLENGIEESYYFADMLSEETPKSATRSSKIQSELGSRIREILANTRASYDFDPDILQYGDYQIYWPYSEDWDGKTQPVITFVPEEEGQLWNYAYKQTENGIETIIVDEPYMESNPVWIINKADIPYEELPNFSENEFEKNGVQYCPRKITVDSNNSTSEGNITRAAGTPVYTVYLGKFMSSKNYDDVFNGGSEFAIQMGAIEKMEVTSLDQLKIASPEVTYLRVTRSRKDIKKKRWAVLSSAILSSDWYPNENNAGFMIYEEDQGGKKYFDASLSIKLGGKDYGFNVKMPYGSGDDLIYKTIYTKNFIFSTNNVNNGVPVEHTSGEVYWTLPYSVGTTNL